MPTRIRILTPTGLEPVDYTADSLADAVPYEPRDGIYTVTNTHQGGKVLRLDAHLDRMEDSATRAGFTLTLDRDGLRDALRTLYHESGFEEMRFRITVGKDDPTRLILTLEPFTPPSPVMIASGVKVITAPGSARHNAAAKTNDWMHDRKRLADAMPPDVYDTILMDDDGHLIEGLGANFYAVLNEELRTAGEGVLAGIAQGIVFDVAPGILPVVKVAVHQDDIPHIAEAFITSSSRGVIPVVAINGHTLGVGIPGPYTTALRHAYNAWVDEHLKPL